MLSPDQCTKTRYRWHLHALQILACAGIILAWCMRDNQKAAVNPATLAIRLNINKADIHALASLPAIGPSTARNIIDNRTYLGPFKTVEDLKRVPGIGSRTLKRLEPFIRVSE